MKKILLFLFTLFILNINAQACEGDCVVCHPNLVKEDGKLDKDHAILVSCKTCHTQADMEKIDMGSGCGQDCWDCHDIKKVTASNVEEHRGLQKCIDCHLTIDKSMLSGVSAPAFSGLPSLDELMSQGVESGIIEVNESDIVDEMNKTEEVLRVEEPQEDNRSNVEEKTEKVEMGTWDKISHFFKSIWQSIVSIFT